MSSREVRTAAPESVVAAAAFLSWALPFLAMTVIGFSERGDAVLGVPRESLVAMAEIAAVIGLAFGGAAVVATRNASDAPDAPGGTLRRRAFLGTGACVLLLLVTQVASIAGAVSGRRAEVELAAALDKATRDYPGWNGVARLKDGATVYAVEIDGSSEFAKLVLRQYGRPYRIVLLGGDNRAGTGTLTIDLLGARTVRSQGASGSAVLHAEMSARAGESALPAVSQPEALRIPKGGSHDGAVVLFPPDESFRDVRWIEMRVNGQPHRIPGKFFTLAEKRGIDAARNAGKTR